MTNMDRDSPQVAPNSLIWRPQRSQGLAWSSNMCTSNAHVSAATLRATASQHSRYVEQGRCRHPLVASAARRLYLCLYRFNVFYPLPPFVSLCYNFLSCPSSMPLSLSLTRVSWLPSRTPLTRSSPRLWLRRLSSATEKSPPSDNDRYVSRCGDKSPKETVWAFHDDKA